MFRFLIISTILLSSGCAALALVDVPELSKRTLRIDRTSPGFVYSYYICAKKFLGICTKTEFKTDKYDLNDPVVRNKLADMGFVGVVRTDPIK